MNSGKKKDITANREHRGNKAFKGIVVALMLCLLVFCSSAAVFADPENGDPKQPVTITEPEGAFEVTEYDFTAQVGKDHSYKVEEKISVNLPADLQIIEFAIPSGNFRISDVEVENTVFQANQASEASKVYIADPEKLSKGAHVYTIKYNIQEFRDRDDSKDMFYFDVLLPEWKQPIGKVNVNVSFPDDFPWDDMQCYSGQFGVQDSTNKITFKASKKNRTVKVTGSLVPENYGITLKAQLPDGYWEGALDGSWSLTAITAIMAGVSLLLLILWFIGGRDPRVKREPVTKPIEGLSPVELGYTFNGRVRTRDVLHMIIQFAQKGYLRISEYEPKRYKLIKGERPTGEEKMYRNALKILFEGVYKGRALDMERIPARVERIREAIADDVAAGFASSESAPFTPISRAFRYAGAAILGIGIALATGISYFYNYQQPNYIESIVTGAVTAAAALLLCEAVDRHYSSSVNSSRYTELLAAFVFALPVIYASYRVAANTGKPIAGFPMVIAAAVAEFFIIIMRARGKDNAVLVNKIRRLRNFIYHPTPKELLENHLADSDYYYDMMLYALAFGAEESWAISFLTLDVPEPDWYTDDIEGHAFSNLREKPTNLDYARDLRSFIITFESKAPKKIRSG
ncbi:MAG: DUF2207 domain-containing protein [Mogibacterium sp.]|nr:DUF2207 domain-containing protein [Mogibacterium sp.]